MHLPTPAVSAQKKAKVEIIVMGNAGNEESNQLFLDPSFSFKFKVSQLYFVEEDPKVFDSPREVSSFLLDSGLGSGDAVGMREGEYEDVGGRVRTRP